MSLVERVRAKKRESEREEEKTSLLNENMGLADRIRNRASIDSDSLERDIKNFEAEYNTAKKWWHNAEDMSNLRNKAESILNRVNAYANSGSYTVRFLTILIFYPINTVCMTVKMPTSQVMSTGMN